MAAKCNAFAPVESTMVTSGIVCQNNSTTSKYTHELQLGVMAFDYETL